MPRIPTPRVVVCCGVRPGGHGYWLFRRGTSARPPLRRRPAPSLGVESGGDARPRMRHAPVRGVLLRRTEARPEGPACRCNAGRGLRGSRSSCTLGQRTWMTTCRRLGGLVFDIPPLPCVRPARWSPGSGLRACDTAGRGRRGFRSGDGGHCRLATRGQVPFRRRSSDGDAEIPSPTDCHGRRGQWDGVRRKPRETHRGLGSKLARNQMLAAARYLPTTSGIVLKMGRFWAKCEVGRASARTATEELVGGSRSKWLYDNGR